jgi:hypothetical protein
VTSFEDCRRELLERGGAPAQNAYRQWLGRTGFDAVHDFVQGFEHRYLDQITLEEMADVRARSVHALGNVKTEEQLPEVENWTTPFAFQHLFHKYLEQQQRVPTWQDFRAWLNGDEAAFFVTPLLQDTGWHAANTDRRRQLRRAYRWRLGKFYYSAMKELDLHVRLRKEHGLPVRYHLLADVLLRTDFWCGDHIVCVYFPNPQYRDQQAGRKPPAERFLGRASPPFTIHHVAIERQGHGNFWMATDESIQQLAHALGA